MNESTFDESGLTDQQLDALLHAAGTDLLTYVRATSDPTRGLLALMSDRAEPAPGTHRNPKAPHAASVLTARAKTSAFLTAMRPIGLVVAIQDIYDLACALTRALDHARDLGQDHDRARGLARDLDRALARARDFDHDLARDFAGDLARALNRDHDRDYDRDRVFARARTRARTLARAQVRDLSQTLAHIDVLLPSAAALRTIGLDPRLAPSLDPDLTQLDVEALYRTAHRLLPALMDLQVDASGVDLSGLELGPGDLKTLVGVMWTTDTCWPDDLATFVEHRSRQIADGLFQVIDGDALNDADVFTKKL